MLNILCQTVREITNAGCSELVKLVLSMVGRILNVEMARGGVMIDLQYVHDAYLNYRSCRPALEEDRNAPHCTADGSWHHGHHRNGDAVRGFDAHDTMIATNASDGGDGCRSPSSRDR